MLKKLCARTDFQFLCGGVLMPLVFSLTQEPSKWVAAGSVAFCAVLAWFFASNRWVEGFEAGIDFQKMVDKEARVANEPVDDAVTSTKKEKT